jgi:hypothetical protein
MHEAALDRALGTADPRGLKLDPDSIRAALLLGRRSRGRSTPKR